MSEREPPPSAEPPPPAGPPALRLADLIRLAGVPLGEAGDYKLHLATDPGDNPPLDAFFDGTFQRWQERQGKRNFQCPQVLSLIQLGGDRWLFAGVWAVLGLTDHGDEVQPDGWAGFTYETEPVAGLDHLVGRAVATFRRTGRQPYVWGLGLEDRLVVCEIKPTRLTVGEFPGFNDVLLPLRRLRTIVREGNPSWRAALGNVAGIYLIVDTAGGGRYVGSARGGVGLWQRWSDYAATGHGGNRELKALLRAEPPGYERNFQFTLLEVCDLDAGEEFILARESHWKRALQTREFGLNAN